jgi:uncharacterized membrane protein YczE
MIYVDRLGQMKKIMDLIKSVNFVSVGKRSIFLAISIVLMYFGISCYYQCGLGTDPYSVLVSGQHSFMGLTYGQVTNVNNAVLLLLMILFGRKYVNIGTVINLIVAGTLIDVFNEMLIAMFPRMSLWGQVAMLLCGVVLFAVGVGVYIVTDLGIGGLEFVTIIVSEKMKINLRWVRIFFDVLFMLAGMLLGVLAHRRIFGDLVGLGTILGAFGTGIIMKFTIRLLEKPLNSWFGPIRRVEQTSLATEDICGTK